MQNQTMKNIEAVLFDLDGVLVDTAKYHYQSWKAIAEKWDLNLTPQANENLKGLSRKDSLHQILSWADVSLSEAEFNSCLEQKNALYLSLIASLSPQDLLPGVTDWLQFLTQNQYKIGLGSASKNASAILTKLEILHYFETLVDGNQVQLGKPNPEVFLLGSEKLGVSAVNCLVVEDSIAGIEAAKRAQMKTLAIGNPTHFQQADYCVASLDKLLPAQLLKTVKKN